MRFGVDEAGKGPVLGSMFAAAVRADPAGLPEGVGDSKGIAPAERERLDEQIRAAADSVAVLLEDGPLTATETAARVGIADATLSWHRGRLAEAGLLASEDGRLVVPEPERTAALLDRADPSIPERLVDRFTRLVDDLLD